MDVDSICRLCASKDGFKINLFEKRLGYIDKIKRFIPLQISKDDKLPSKICFRCAMLITDFEKFCLNCISVQETLLKGNFHREESISEEHLDPEPKSNNTMQGANIPDDDSNDHDSDWSMNTSIVESNDTCGTARYSVSEESDCNQETLSRPSQKRKSHTNAKVSKQLFENHSPRDNESPTMPASLIEKPSHLMETRVPTIPGSSHSIYTCEYCNKMFTTKNTAFTHVCPDLLNNCKREFVERSNSYTCELCYQVFSRQAVLQAHRVGHMNNSSGEGSGDEIYDENACVFGQKKKKKRRGNRVTRDGLGYKPFFQNEEEEGGEENE